MKRAPRLAVIANTLAAVVAAMVMSGCSADDVEFNGGLFKMAGLGNTAKATEPKMAARPGLVVPPNLERLPSPGAQPGAEAADISAIDDPDKKLAVSQADLEKQQAAYCDKHYHMALAHGDQAGATLAEGPLGPCRGSFFNTFSKKTADQ